MRRRIAAGDLFEIPFSDERVFFFQYLAKDRLELDSDVIRVFKRKSNASEHRDLTRIAKGDILFHTHVFLHAGLDAGAWKWIAKADIDKGHGEPAFRSSRDYGDPSIRESSRWDVWRLGDSEVSFVGPLDPERRMYDIAGVWRPEAVIERIDKGSLTWFYPSG